MVDSSDIELDGLSQLLVKPDGGSAVKNQFNFIKEFVHVLVTQTEMFLDDVAGNDVYRRESLWLRLLQIVKYLR